MEAIDEATTKFTNYIQVGAVAGALLRHLSCDRTGGIAIAGASSHFRARRSRAEQILVTATGGGAS